MSTQFKIFPGLIVASTVFSVASISEPQIVSAAVLRIGESAFTAQAGLITFSEKPLGTTNPTYSPSEYGGGVSAPTVSFGGTFTGQTVGTTPIPPGAAPTGVVNGTPTASLSLNPSSPNTFITIDDNPVLSGTPIFNGPISILFNTDVAGVGLRGGFFDAIGGTAITAFARNGTSLGSVTNATTGFEFLGLVTDDGTAQIAGLQFSLVGAEPAGYGIDNIRFGLTGQVVVPGGVTAVPEPFTIVGTMIGGAAALRMRKRLKVTNKL
jgi:hypothetical protein